MEDDFVPDIEPPQYEILRQKIKDNKMIYCINEETANKIKQDIPDLRCCYEYNNNYEVYIIDEKTVIQDISNLKPETFIYCHFKKNI
jgi:hypothetical protein